MKTHRPIKSLAAGDRVKVAAGFLKITEAFAGWEHQARGVVTAIKSPYPKAPGFLMATVQWDEGRVTKMNVANLVPENEVEAD
jgi:hypothetical protein